MRELDHVRKCAPTIAQGENFLRNDPKSTGSRSLTFARRRIPNTSATALARYREIQTAWQSHDAYARVCMAIGTTEFLQASASRFSLRISKLAAALERPFAALDRACEFRTMLRWTDHSLLWAVPLHD